MNGSPGLVILKEQRLSWSTYTCPALKSRLSPGSPLLKGPAENQGQHNILTCAWGPGPGPSQRQFSGPGPFPPAEQAKTPLGPCGKQAEIGAHKTHLRSQLHHGRVVGGSGGGARLPGERGLCSLAGTRYGRSPAEGWKANGFPTDNRFTSAASLLLGEGFEMEDMTTILCVSCVLARHRTNPQNSVKCQLYFTREENEAYNFVSASVLVWIRTQPQVSCPRSITTGEGLTFHHQFRHVIRSLILSTCCLPDAVPNPGNSNLSPTPFNRDFVSLLLKYPPVQFLTSVILLQ